MSDTFHAPAQSRPLAMTLMLMASALIAVTTLFAKALGTDALGTPLHPVQVTHGRFLFAFLSLLGETVGRWRWSAAAIALLGALIFLRPGTESFRPAALLALGSAVVMGLEVIFIKKLSGRERVFQVLLINNALGLCIASGAVLPFWQMPSPEQWLAMAGLGLAMALAQTCFINSMARADASLVAPLAYATLVFATLYDAAIFGMLPDWISVLGAVVILTGGSLLAWREGRAIRV